MSNEILKGVTPAPWFYDGVFYNDYGGKYHAVSSDGVSDDVLGSSDITKEDAEFIAWARNNIEALLEALESIANNTCCGDCQEAKRVAQKALNKPNQESDDV